MMEKKRSVGVTVFGWINILAGILWILGAGISGRLGFVLAAKGIILIASLFIVIGIGLLKLKEWARKLEILLPILGCFFQWALVLIVSKNLLISIRYMFHLEQIIPLLVTIIIVYFFTRLKVKAQFSPPKKEVV